MSISDELDAQILAERARLNPGPRRWERAPEACKVCRTPFRPKGADVADYPGTLTHAGRGYCSTHLARFYMHGGDS